MNFIRAAAAVLATAITAVSYIAMIAVLILGTWWAIRKFIAGDIINGILVLGATAVATAFTQAIIGFVAVPFLALAESRARRF